MSTSTAPSRSRVDEEDDDLDDLDDVLDQFSTPAPPSSNNNNVNASASTSTSTSSQPSKPPHSAADAPTQDALTEDLAVELAKQMETFLTGLGIPSGAGSEGAGTDGTGVEERERLAAAWEAMLVEEMNSMSPSTSALTSNAHTSVDASSTLAGSDFQSRLRATVNKRRERESELHPSDSSADVAASSDMFKSIMSQLEGFGDDGPQSEEQIQGVLEAMMSQLLGKEVLYEPLKELHEKFPGYLTDHASTISPEDKARYEAQIACIKRLIDEFEAKTYRDDDQGAHEKIVTLMSELQSYGQPPEEIMGPLPPGFNLGADGLPEMPDGCNMN